MNATHARSVSKSTNWAQWSSRVGAGPCTAAAQRATFSAEKADSDIMRHITLPLHANSRSAGLWE